MNRFIPSRPLALAVFLLWLLLEGEFGLGALLFALLLALVLPLLGEPLRHSRARMQRPGTALRLAGVVLWDIVVSNIEVARLVLGRQSRIHPGFVVVPLDLTNDHGITALAGIITLTPGTVSAELSADRRALLVHCLNLTDPAATVAQIKQRYEAPLKEIFP